MQEQEQLMQSRKLQNLCAGALPAHHASEVSNGLPSLSFHVVSDATRQRHPALAALRQQCPCGVVASMQQNCAAGVAYL